MATCRSHEADSGYSDATGLIEELSLTTGNQTPIAPNLRINDSTILASCIVPEQKGKADRYIAFQTGSGTISVWGTTEASGKCSSGI